MNIIPKFYINLIKRNLQFIIGFLVLIITIVFLYQIFSNKIIEGNDNQIQIHFKSPTFQSIYLTNNNSLTPITNLFTDNNQYTLSKINDSSYNLIINESVSYPFIVSAYGDNIMNCMVNLLTNYSSGSSYNFYPSYSNISVTYDSYNKPTNGSFGTLFIKFKSDGKNPTIQSSFNFTVYLLDNTIDKEIINNISSTHKYDFNTITGIITNFSSSDSSVVTNTNNNNLTIYKSDISKNDIITNINTSQFIPLISKYFIQNGYLQKDNNKIHSVYFTDNKETDNKETDNKETDKKETDKKETSLFMYNESSFINNRFISGYIKDSIIYPCIIEITK
jgi:hypothetical protein